MENQHLVDDLTETSSPFSHAEKGTAAQISHATPEDGPEEHNDKDSDPDVDSLASDELEDDRMDAYFVGIEGIGGPVPQAQEYEPATGDQATIVRAIDNATPNDSLARIVLKLLIFTRISAASAGVRLSRYGLTITPNWTLYLSDVLCLHYLKGYENAAWFTDNVMHTILALEVQKPDDVHVECHLDHFLSADYSDMRDEQFAAALRGEEPTLGWPLKDMKATHKRMVAVINPTEAHWVTIEFVRATEDQPAKLFYYNSLQSTSGKGTTSKALIQSFPKILYLASLRPGSPLAGFNPDELVVEAVPCPQQHGGFDCGPFALYFATQRIHDQPVWKDLDGSDEQHEFGQYLRRQCARVLQNECFGRNHLISLREILDALPQKDDVLPQQEPEDVHSSNLLYSTMSGLYHVMKGVLLAPFT